MPAGAGGAATGRRNRFMGTRHPSNLCVYNDIRMRYPCNCCVCVHVLCACVVCVCAHAPAPHQLPLLQYCVSAARRARKLQTCMKLIRLF